MSVKLHLSNLNADVSKTHDMQTGSTRNPSPYDVGERKSNEAGDIYETLELLLNFLGGAYSELSGHAAAAQRVVSDLRRSLSFLNSRYFFVSIVHPNRLACCHFHGSRCSVLVGADL